MPLAPRLVPTLALLAGLLTAAAQEQPAPTSQPAPAADAPQGEAASTPAATPKVDDAGVITVVGSRRADAELANVPGSITVVEQPTVRRELATSRRIEDILQRNVPGFNPTNEGVRQIRGRTAQVLINGVPMNEQMRASSGNDLNVILPEQLAGVEVGRGANSAYGFGSPGGIIALSTPRATSREVTFTTRLSESLNPHHVQRSHQAVLYQGVSQIVGDFDYHLGVAAGYDGSQYDPDGHLTSGQSESALIGSSEEFLGSADTSLGYDLHDAGRLRFSGTFSRVDFRRRHEASGGIYREQYATQIEQPRGSDAYRNGYTANLAYEHDRLLGHAVRLEAFRSATHTEFFSDTGTQVVRDEQDNAYTGFRSSLTAPIGAWIADKPGVSLTYGLDGIRNTYERPRTNADTGALVTWIAPPVTLDTVAVHGQLDVPVGARLDLTGGVRHERYSGSVDTAVGPGGIVGGDIDSFSLTLVNLGAVVHLDEHLDVFATYAQGAEVSQLGRAARNGVDASRVDPQPAKSDQYETGVRGQWTDASFSLAGFYTTSDLMSVLQNNPDDPTGPLIPLREPRRFWGVEATGDWRIDERFAVGTTVAWIDGERETPQGDERIGAREAPPLLLSPWIGYSPTRWWRNRLLVMYRAARGAVGDGTDFGAGRVEDNVVVNAQMAFDAGPGELELGASNLFNSEYTAISTEANNFDDTWLPEEGTRLTAAYTVIW